MSRGIAGVIRSREQGRNRGIQLDWANGPIGILAVPAGNHGVVSGDALDCVSASCSRRIVFQAILKYLLVQEIAPERECLTLPEKTFAFCVKRRTRSRGRTQSGKDAGKALDYGKLGRFLSRVTKRWGIWPKLASAGKHPGFPGARKRFDRVCSLPIAQTVRDASAEHCVGSIGLRPGDYQSRHFLTQLKTCLHIAWILHTVQKPSRSRCRGLIGERLWVGGKQVRKYGGCRARSNGRLAWIRGTIGVGNCSAETLYKIAWPRAVIGIFGIPGRHHCVVDRNIDESEHTLATRCVAIEFRNLCDRDLVPLVGR